MATLEYTRQKTQPCPQGQVAQLEEHTTDNREVSGSIPLLPTTRPPLAWQAEPFKSVEVAKKLKKGLDKMTKMCYNKGTNQGSGELDSVASIERTEGVEPELK